MSRYLTPHEKAETVNFWLKTRWAQVPTSLMAIEHIELGGFDWPDPPIFAYTDRLNALEGVCTISSCMGHQIVGDQFYEGHLWFRLSEKNSKIFEKHAIELAREAITLRKSYNLARSTHYWEWYEVEFPGGSETLAEAIEPIVRFFEHHFSAVHPVQQGEAETEPDAVRSLLEADPEATGTTPVSV